MKTMQDWFDAYGVSHVNKTNKAIHWICVPLIFFSIVGLLSLIPFAFVANFFPEGILELLPSQSLSRQFRQHGLFLELQTCWDRERFVPVRLQTNMLC